VVECPLCGHRNVCPAIRSTPEVHPGGRPPGSLAGLAASSWSWTIGVSLAALAGCCAWFLLSSKASGEGGGVPPSDPVQARQYQILHQDIDQPGDPELMTLFQTINRGHFAGRLPAMAVRWEPALAAIGAGVSDDFTLEGMFGHVGKKPIILINPAIRATAGALDRVLCHEMVHAYLYSIGDDTTNHGPAFKAELKRLSSEGAFEGIAATDDEKTELRAWLDAESARLDADRKEVDEVGAAIATEREEIARALALASESGAAALEQRRDEFNQRVIELNARIDRGRDALAHFNDEVARYNLMLSYPDGMDEAATVQKKVK